MVSYAVASLSLYMEEVGYRYYVTELLRMNAEGKTWNMSYLEYLDYEPPEERSVDDIVFDVTARAGLEVIE